MSEVTLQINGTDYEIACEPGQEDRLRELAGRIDSKISDITATSGQAGQSRLLLMAALMLIDEIEEAGGSKSSDDSVEQAQVYVASVFEQMTDRINKITDRL
jgi:cell division protein ZapA